MDPHSVDRAGTLFYATHLGSGAIVVPIIRDSPGPFAEPNDLKTTRTFPTGNFTTDWTHVAATRSHVFFYNRSDGSAAVSALLFAPAQVLQISLLTLQRQWYRARRWLYEQLQAKPNSRATWR